MSLPSHNLKSTLTSRGEGGGCLWFKKSKKSKKLINRFCEYLSRDELFNRCLDDEIQNNNESLNSLIWYFAPNYLRSGAKIVQIATYIAIQYVICNKVFRRILKSMTIVAKRMLMYKIVLKRFMLETQFWRGMKVS